MISTQIKLAGAYKIARRMLTKVAGAWKPVRRAFVKINGQWKLCYTDTRFMLYVLGYNQTVYTMTSAGLWFNNAKIAGTSRSYSIILFDADGNETFNQTYDIYGEHYGEASGQVAAMTNKLNSLPNGQLIAVISYDEPQSGRMVGGLPEAMARVGATRFGNDYIAYRGCYAFLGKVGQAAIAEMISGADVGNGQPGDPDAAINIRFDIRGNNFIDVVAKTGR